MFDCNSFEDVTASQANWRRLSEILHRILRVSEGRRQRLVINLRDFKSSRQTKEYQSLNLLVLGAVHKSTGVTLLPQTALQLSQQNRFK